MTTLRSALAGILSFALIALSPGFGAYHAAAQMVNSAATGAAAPGAAAGAVGMQTGVAGQGLLPLAPLPALTKAALVVTPNVLVQTGLTYRAAATTRAGANAVAVTGQGLATAGRSATVGLPAAVVAAAARAQTPAKETPRTAIGDLQRDIPDFGRMGTDDARGALDADMARRLGENGSWKTSAFVEGSVRAQATGGEGVSLKKGEKRMPQEKGPRGPHFEEPDDSGRSEGDVGSLDELGNPRREQSDGPDSVPGEFGGRAGSFLSALPVTISVAATGALAAATNIALLPVYFGIIIPSLILHEMGHAKVAEWLGDPTARLAGRLSFKPRDLLTHIDPFWTLLMPALTITFGGMIFGGANPVRVNPANLLSPDADQAKIALAGPAVNFGLALLGGFGHAAALAIGLTTVGSLLQLVVYFNVMLGVFNLLPFNPLDGSHIVRWVLKTDIVNSFLPGRSVADTLDRNAPMQIVIGMLLLFSLLGPSLAMFSYWLTGVFMNGVGLLGGAQLATGALPAIAALGLMVRPLFGPADKVGRLNPGPVETRITAGRQQAIDGSSNAPIVEPLKLLVRLTGAPKPLPRFTHMELAAKPTRGGLVGQAEALAYADKFNGMLTDLEAAGLGRQVLEQFGAAPVATYDLINTVTILVPADRAGAFRGAMEAKGFRVDDNKQRRIIEPVEPDLNRPDAPGPNARGAVTVGETLTLSDIASAHAKGKELWGPPAVGLGFLGRATLRTLRLLGAKLPEPVIAVIDSGIDPKHKVLKQVKESINVTNGKPDDDIGHGSWTHGAVLAYAPWLKSSIHIRTFVDGGASTDDILKALSVAREKKAILTSNSWGSDDGDPDGPDSRMVYEMAKEGRVMVFAGGNAGSGKNTVGSPAIMAYVDPVTGAPRVLSIAATDREKKVAYFSSRGPGSPTTSTNDKYKDWPHRPDLAEEGFNTEGPWPTYMRADRTDPVYGPVKAISGTSMSTPKVAGTIAHLAMLFGVTEVGPQLDAIVNAVMKTLTPNGQPDDVGGGFNHVSAAFAELTKTMNPVMPSFAARILVRSFERQNLGFGRRAGRVAAAAVAVAAVGVGMASAFLTLGSAGFWLPLAAIAAGAFGIMSAIRLNWDHHDGWAALVAFVSLSSAGFGIWSLAFEILHRILA